jgi:hypothetical protein
MMSPILNYSKETFVAKFNYAIEQRAETFVVLDRRTNKTVGSANTKADAIRIAKELRRNYQRISNTVHLGNEGGR